MKWHDLFLAIANRVAEPERAYDFIILEDLFVLLTDNQIDIRELFRAKYERAVGKDIPEADLCLTIPRHEEVLEQKSFKESCQLYFFIRQAEYINIAMERKGK